MADGHIACFEELDGLKDRVKRLRLRCEHDLPAAFAIPSALRTTVSGREALIAVAEVGPELIPSLEATWDAEVSVEDLSLEEIYFLNSADHRRVDHDEPTPARTQHLSVSQTVLVCSAAFMCYSPLPIGRFLIVRRLDCGSKLKCAGYRRRRLTESTAFLQWTATGQELLDLKNLTINGSFIVDNRSAQRQWATAERIETRLRGHASVSQEA